MVRKILFTILKEFEKLLKRSWYLWALQRLGLRYRHETFGRRNAVEEFFSQLKREQRSFGTDSHTRVPLFQFRAG